MTNQEAVKQIARDIFRENKICITIKSQFKERRDA